MKEEKEIRTINQRHRPPQRRITRIKAKIYETQSKHRTTDNWSEKLWNWCSKHYDDNKQAPHHIPTLKTTTYRHHQHYQLTKTQHIDISVSNCECKKSFTCGSSVSAKNILSMYTKVLPCFESHYGFISLCPFSNLIECWQHQKAHFEPQNYLFICSSIFWSQLKSSNDQRKV